MSTMKMKRLPLMVPVCLATWLKAQADKKGISVAELVRRILDRAHEDQQKQ
jgi:hypothetical protein